MILTHSNCFIQTINKLLTANVSVNEAINVAHLVDSSKRVKFIDKRAVSDQFLRKMGQYISKVSAESQDLSYIRDLLDEIN